MKFFTIFALAGAAIVSALPANEWENMKCPPAETKIEYKTVTEVKPEKQIEYKTEYKTVTETKEVPKVEYKTKEVTKEVPKVEYKTETKEVTKVVEKPVTKVGKCNGDIGLSTSLTLYTETKEVTKTEFKKEEVTKTEYKEKIITPAPVKGEFTHAVHHIASVLTTTQSTSQRSSTSLLPRSVRSNGASGTERWRLLPEQVQNDGMI